DELLVELVVRELDDLDLDPGLLLVQRCDRFQRRVLVALDRGDGELGGLVAAARRRRLTRSDDDESEHRERECLSPRCHVLLPREPGDRTWTRRRFILRSRP